MQRVIPVKIACLSYSRAKTAMWRHSKPLSGAG